MNEKTGYLRSPLHFNFVMKFLLFHLKSGWKNFSFSIWSCRSNSYSPRVLKNLDFFFLTRNSIHLYSLSFLTFEFEAGLHWVMILLIKVFVSLLGNYESMHLSVAGKVSQIY